MNWFEQQRARRKSGRRLDARERAERIAAETPPALSSPELLPPSAEEIAEAEAAEERYLAGNLRKYYLPGELGELRRSQRED